MNRSQYHREAPADLTPDMYDDPYLEFAAPEDDDLLDREEVGYYDEQRWADDAEAPF